MILRTIIFIVFITFVFSCQPEKKSDDIEAKLYFVIGDVSVNGQKAQIHQNIQNQDELRTGAESTAEIRLGVSAGCQIRENTTAQILKNATSWEIKVHKGSVLNLVERGRNYRLRGPAAVVAVRGTIFYVHCYEDSSQYMCTCNGTVNIEYGDQVQTVSASHHKPYTIHSAADKILADDMMKEHNDEEIFDFMYRLDQAMRVE